LYFSCRECIIFLCLQINVLAHENRIYILYLIQILPIWASAIVAEEIYFEAKSTSCKLQYWDLRIVSLEDCRWPWVFSWVLIFFKNSRGSWNWKIFQFLKDSRPDSTDVLKTKNQASQIWVLCIQGTPLHHI